MTWHATRPAHTHRQCARQPGACANVAPRGAQNTGSGAAWHLELVPQKGVNVGHGDGEYDAEVVRRSNGHGRAMSRGESSGARADCGLAWQAESANPSLVCALVIHRQMSFCTLGSGHQAASCRATHHAVGRLCGPLSFAGKLTQSTAHPHTCMRAPRAAQNLARAQHEAVG